MAGPPQVALPAVLRRQRAGAWAEAARPFTVAAAAGALLAVDDGGYLATTWGWAALVLAWVAGLSLVLRDARVSRLELGWIGALSLLTAWTAASMLWTSTQTQTALAVERTFVYLLAAIAVVVATRSFAYRSLLWGAWAGSSIACLYGLATRLFPDRFGAADPIAGYRLSDPIGYWNGLGLLTAIAIVLAAGLATYGGRSWARAVAAASVPLLLPTLYFTFSRGAWFALAASLVVAFALSAQRVSLASSVLVQALPAAAAMWLAHRSKPLGETTSHLAASAHAGHRLAWQLLLVAAGAAALRLGYDAIGRRAHVPVRVQRGFGILLLAAMLAGAFVAVVHYGGPDTALHRAKRSIEGNPADGANLNQRLFSLSSNGRLREWHVALAEWRAHKLLGGGAGSFAQHWAAAGPNQPQLLNAHNLYLETLAELGPIGLALLAATLLVPLVAAVRARRRSLVPIAAAGYAAWLIHVAYDWDWQLPGVTIAAILCAGALLVAARSRGVVAPTAVVRPALLALVAVIGVAALLGLFGNRALARSANAVHSGDYSSAVAAAADARRWQPWSSAPWAQLAFIHRLQKDPAAERAAYERAIAKDPRNWQLWLGLTSVTHGAAYKHALHRLAALSPAAAAGTRRKH